MQKLLEFYIAGILMGFFFAQFTITARRDVSRRTERKNRNTRRR